MTSVRDTALDYISAFFNDDGRARQFIVAAYKNGIYDKPLDEVCDNFYESSLWQLMRCENYNDWEALEARGVQPDDIHPDFVDFIQQTACFHRMLDNMQHKSAFLSEHISDVKTRLNEVMSAKSTEEERNRNYSKLMLAIDKYEEYLSDSLNEVVPDETYQDALHILQYIRILNVLQKFVNNDTKMIIEDATIIDDAQKKILSNERSDKYKEYFDKILKYKFNFTTRFKYNNKPSRTSLPDQYITLSTIIRSMMNPDIALRSSRQFNYNSYESKDNDLFLEILTYFLHELKLVKDKISKNISQNEEEISRLDTVIAEIEDLHNFLQNKITLDSEFNVEPKVKRSTVSLWDRVFSKWNRLPTEAKEFYKKHIRLMGQTSTNEWVVLETPDNNNMENKNLRFNLMKSDKDKPSSAILFGETLPKIPKLPRGNRIHIYPGSNILTEQQIYSYSTHDSLKKIYNDAYNGKGNMIESENGKNCGTPKASGFNLNPIRYSQNLVKNVKQCMKNKTVASKSIESILDLVTGQVIQRNAAGVYLKDDVPLNYDVLVNSTCGGTGLLRNQDLNCLNLINCLLDDSRGLDTCLDVLRNRDTFSAGRDAARNAHPDVLVKLLRKLGVPIIKRDSMYGTIDTPVSFESWIRNVENASLRDVLHGNEKRKIEKNENLINYIKGVISFVSQNPAILNSNINQNTLPQYLTGTKMDWTRDLVKDSPEAFKLGSKVLEFARKSGLIGKSFVLSGGMVPSSEKNSSFIHLNSMIKNGRKLMEQNGKYLVPEDNEAINQLLIKYGNNEKTITKLSKILHAYNESQHIKRVGGTKKLSEIINDVNEVKALYGGGESNEFTNSINKIFAQQNKIYNKLIFELYPAMINSAFEGDNSVIRKV